jgi:hypothetical protein
LSGNPSASINAIFAAAGGQAPPESHQVPQDVKQELEQGARPLVLDPFMDDSPVLKVSDSANRLVRTTFRHNPLHES